MKAQFSLNHDTIGTRFSGSFSGDQDQDWSWEGTAPEEGSYYRDIMGGISLDDWAKIAQIGQKYYVAPSVYWARVE